MVAARRASTEDGGFQRFTTLFEDAVEGGLYEAKRLVATIMSQPEDNGEGEAVLSILSGFNPEIRARTILEELPRLDAQNEDDWADTLVETLARFNPKELIKVANELSDSLVRSHLRMVLARLSEQAKRRGATDEAGPLLLALR